MTLPVKLRFDPSFPIIAGKDGAPTQLFRDYMRGLDALVAALAAGGVPPLADAANDAAAAAAGVKVQQLYRNGSQLMVRVV